MKTIQFISTNNLKPADAVELVCPNGGILAHYTVYLGNRNGLPKFFANITYGIRILNKEKLTEFVQLYKVKNIESFNGNYIQEGYTGKDKQEAGTCCNYVNNGVSFYRII